MKLLDHGYLNLIETWGSDERIIEAARMSTGKGFQGWGPKDCPDCTNRNYTHPEECSTCNGSSKVPGDEKLLRYLYRNKHATPFEMAGMVVEVQAPIFVFREWHRHRTQSYNEMSARYVPLPDVNYIPSLERLIVIPGGNKQAGMIPEADKLTRDRAEMYRQELIDQWSSQQSLYEKALRIGVPKELARVHLGVGRYSRMRASANLRNWLAFLTLRMAENAQWEIRQYANAVGSLVKEHFPRTWELFIE